jgi:hypothetical protein
MLNAPLLDAGFGLMFFYFFASLLCSVIIAVVASPIGKRPRTLSEAISLFPGGDTQALEKPYAQPLFIGTVLKALVKSIGGSLLTLLPPPSSWLKTPKVPSYSFSRFVLIVLGLAMLANPSLAATPEVNYIDAPTLKGMLGDPDLVIIDTSTGWWTYDQKIVGSLVFPEEASSWAPKLSKDKRIVLYCG